MKREGPGRATGVSPSTASAAPLGGSLIYVYGITRAGAMSPGAAALVEGIVPGTCVELVPEGKIAAVVSRVPRDVFTSGSAGAEEAGALASERMLAHHRVLADLAHFCTVAPMRFGVTCRSFAELLDTLTRSAALFERALARTEGAREWRIKLHADVDVCRAAVRATLARKPPSPAPGGTSAISVFLRRKAPRDLDREVLRDLEARAESVHRLITTKTREAAPDTSCGLCAGWNGYAPALILKSAYLVEKAGEATFKQAMADLGEALEAEGCNLEVTGPWPPYSFAAVDVASAEPQDR